MNRRLERQEARWRRRVYRREYLRRPDAGNAVFCASRDNVSYERHLRYGLADRSRAPSRGGVSERIEVMPEIIVYAVEGRTAEQKKSLMKDITDAVVKNFHAPLEAVTVQIVESKKDSKAKGGVPFTER
jgi:4-oxalocrotonate tautomerase